MSAAVRRYTSTVVRILCLMPTMEPDRIIGMRAEGDALRASELITQPADKNKGTGITRYLSPFSCHPSSRPGFSQFCCRGL